jgi:hypothetical protein
MKPLPSVDAGHTRAPDMSAGFGSWLLGASALGGMLGMASSIFIVLAATTFGSALLYAISGFGFAVLAVPPFLLFLDPERAIEVVIIISTVLSIVVLRGLLPAIARGCCFAWRSAVLLGCRSASSPSVMLIRSWCGRPLGQ